MQLKVLSFPKSFELLKRNQKVTIYVVINKYNCSGPPHFKVEDEQ